jgi:regulator of CtrA degradation
VSEDRTSGGLGTVRPIVFGQRLAGSEVFKGLFREGMALVEETATYLDGEGRQDSRRLTRAGSLAYATESMRLTTRLMQVASWLLLQRAVNEGEMSAEQAGVERQKVKLTGFATSTDGPGWQDMPDRLRLLIERSLKLQERVRRLNEAMETAQAIPSAENPVFREFGRVARAFGAAGK